MSDFRPRWHRPPGGRDIDHPSGRGGDSGPLDEGLVTRVRARGAELDPPLLLALMVGPEDGLATEDLELAWRRHGESIHNNTRRYGCRAWGWWVFEVGERSPQEQEPRLEELGELTDEELEEIAERASLARTRVGTPREHRGPNYSADRRAIGLAERVSAIRKR